MDLAESNKRKREINFTQNEKQLLISIISKYSNIIEDKKTDRTSMEIKNKAWRDIEREFNSTSWEITYRSGERLKKFYNNKKHDIRILEAEETKIKYLTGQTNTNSEVIKEFYEEEKKKVKGDAADEKKYILQTGMGRLPVQKKDGTEELMLSIMNKKTIYGLECHEFDSDNQNSAIINNEAVQIEYVFDSENDAGLSNIKNKEGIIKEVDRLDNETSHTATWKGGAGFTIKQLGTPINPALNMHVQSTPTKKKDCSRRRPTNSVRTLTSSKFAEKYDTLLDKRLILITKQIKELEEEKDFRRTERKLKLELLQLQINKLKN